MPSLLYTVIKSRKQYNLYCRKLESLLDQHSKARSVNDEIDLLTVLIEKWDDDHNTFTEQDPVELLKTLMEDHQLKAKEMAEFLQVSKGYVSDILHYKKGLSKEITRKLSDRFKLKQEAFNRVYVLKGVKKTAAKKKIKAT